MFHSSWCHIFVSSLFQWKEPCIMQLLGLFCQYLYVYDTVACIVTTCITYDFMLLPHTIQQVMGPELPVTHFTTTYSYTLYNLQHPSTSAGHTLNRPSTAHFNLPSAVHSVLLTLHTTAFMAFTNYSPSSLLLHDTLFPWSHTLALWPTKWQPSQAGGIWAIKRAPSPMKHITSPPQSTKLICGNRHCQICQPRCLVWNNWAWLWGWECKSSQIQHCLL
jgi:hypothetical protein